MINNIKNLTGLKGFVVLTNAEAFEIVGGTRRRRQRRPNTANNPPISVPPTIDLPSAGGADEY
jgi:hypothetical protein